jgi:transposase
MPDLSRAHWCYHSAHISKETKAWFEEQPAGRFQFTFTPKHGSWLNLVEGFFSKLARSVLRHIRVSSKQELKDRIMAAMDFFNREADEARAVSIRLADWCEDLHDCVDARSKLGDRERFLKKCECHRVVTLPGATHKAKRVEDRRTGVWN